MVDCKSFSDRRYSCHAVYGKGGEDCLHEELSEKRCLSLHHCPRQAKDYYGDASMSSSAVEPGHAVSYLMDKGMCASWAESFAYIEKELEYGTAVVTHHRDAKDIVSQDPTLKRECREIAFALAQCLRHKKLF